MLEEEHRSVKLVSYEVHKPEPRLGEDDCRGLFSVSMPSRPWPVSPERIADRAAAEGLASGLITSS